MQIVLFLPHYQLVYANFDFSSFSLINYIAKGHLLEANWALIASQKSIVYFSRCDFILQIEILAKTNQQLLNN